MSTRPAAVVARQRRAARTRLVAAFGLTVVVLGIAAVVEHGGSPAPTHHAASVDNSPAPAPPALRLSLAVPASAVVPGRLPTLPWPATGEGAVGVQGSGLIAAGPGQRSVPIASVTKIMTAYLVLRDHPLSGSEGGPRLTMTEQDALAFQHDAESDDSNLDVVAGEVLDERQLLEGLLIPSADNVADLLAAWDAGSIPAFVAEMNATARALGMTGTHYADASGLDPASRSTAADQVRLASLAMENPVFASIVDHASVRLPVSGEVWNYNPLVGVDGVVGVKSGFTSAAAACLVAAAWRTVGGRRVLLVSAALGQPDGLEGAAAADRALLDAATPLLHVFPVVAAGATVAEALPAWGGAPAAVLAGSGAAVVAWPGATISVGLATATGAGPWVPAPGAAGGADRWVVPAAERVGELLVSMSGGPLESVALHLASGLSGPPAGWTAGS